ncbi:MAG: ABC transporter substrate-binding protein [Archaeoglobales archaeon]|nr:ABC transporter substrate-binding protein [Archaeoglobales archaeon]
MKMGKTMIGLGLIFAIVLLGCTETPKTTPTPVPTTPIETTPAVTTVVQTTPTTTPIAEKTPTTVVTTPSSTPPSLTGEIKVCALYDTRIPAFKANVEALKLAIEEINAQGGIMGKKLELIHQDTQRKVDIAITAYRSAVIEKGCTVVFVEGVSEEVMALLEEGARIYPSHPHIMISPQAGMESTLKVIEDYEKYKFFFRSLPSDPEMNYKVTKVFFDIAKDVVRAKKVALFLEDASWTKCAREGCTYNTKFGSISSKAMKDWVKEEYGLDVVYVSNLAVGEKNFLPILETAAARGAEFIFVLSSWYTDTTTLTKQWASSSARNIPIAFFGGTAQWINAWSLTGGASLGTIVMTYDYEDIPLANSNAGVIIKKLHERGISLDTSTHYAYSEMLRVKEAMEKVGNPDDIDKVIKAIEELEFKNHTIHRAEYIFFGYQNPNFHSYTGGPTMIAQFQCGGKPVYIVPSDVLAKGGYVEESEKVQPDAYKSPAELRKTCK